MHYFLKIFILIKINGFGVHKFILSSLKNIPK